MAVSESYVRFVIDQLSVPVVSKRMFGGAGLYSDGLFFGLIANNTLFFKVDDSNRPDYVAAGMEPFRPYGEGSSSMSYFTVPAEILEDPATLKRWFDKAIAAASTKQHTRKKARRGTP